MPELSNVITNNVTTKNKTVIVQACTVNLVRVVRACPLASWKPSTTILLFNTILGSANAPTAAQSVYTSPSLFRSLARAGTDSNILLASGHQPETGGVHIHFFVLELAKVVVLSNPRHHDERQIDKTLKTLLYVALLTKTFVDSGRR